MTAPTGNPEAISLGPGRIYDAPLGTALPVDLADVLDPAFAFIGYTDDGSEFQYQIASDPVEVAEELDPLFYKTTGRTGSLTFAMAENTAKNMTRAFNGGTVVKTTSGATKYTPPEPGTETRRAIVFESEDGEERWVFPQVFQSGNVSMSRKKGADKVTIPVEFSLEKAAGQPPFMAFYDETRDGSSGAV